MRFPSLSALVVLTATSLPLLGLSPDSFPVSVVASDDVGLTAPAPRDTTLTADQIADDDWADLESPVEIVVWAVPAE